MQKRAQPESLTPAYFFRSHAVNGHADMPEKRVNQPFVSGSGPRVIRSPKPPPPAMIIQAQAAANQVFGQLSSPMRAESFVPFTNY